LDAPQRLLPRIHPNNRDAAARCAQANKTPLAHAPETTPID